MNEKNENLTIEMSMMQTMKLIANQVVENKKETDTRFEELEKNIENLEQKVNDMRDSAIRGEIASGQKTKDVAEKYNLKPSRISQIAPRRKYNNG